MGCRGEKREISRLSYCTTLTKQFKYQSINQSINQRCQGGDITAAVMAEEEG
jgi:hypothetical protein